MSCCMGYSLLVQAVFLNCMWLGMCRGGGQATDWVMIGLDPACPEPDTELQLRAAVLLVLTWDIRKGTGVRCVSALCLQWVNAS